MAMPMKRKLPRLQKEKLTRSGKFKKPIVTEVLPAMKFWPAEDYHQKYYRQNPEHFEAFEEGSGRVSFKKDKWGGQTIADVWLSQDQTLSHTVAVMFERSETSLSISVCESLQIWSEILRFVQNDSTR